MNPAAIFHFMLLAVLMTPPTVAQELSPQAQLEQQIAARLNTALISSGRVTLKSCVLTVTVEGDVPCLGPRFSYMLRSQTDILHLSEITGNVSARASLVSNGDTVLEFKFKPDVEMWLKAYSRSSSDLVDRYPADLPIRFSKLKELSSDFFAKSGVRSRSIAEFCGAELTDGISPRFMMSLEGGRHEDVAADLTRYAQSYCGQ